MANKKSAKKALRRSETQRARNQATESMLKTVVKKAKRAADDQKPAAIKAAVKALDKAAERGIIHKNQAARRKSRLMKTASKPA
jgi:small subunit ribosomal protein S20